MDTRRAPERAGDENAAGRLAEAIGAGDGGERIAVGDRLGEGRRDPAARRAAPSFRARSRRKPARTSSRISAAPAVSQIARAARANSGVGISWSRRTSWRNAVTMSAARSSPACCGGLLQARNVVVVERDDVGAVLGSDADGRGRAPGHGAMIGAARDQDLAPARGGAGERHAGRGGVRAVLGEHRPVGVGDRADQQLGQLHQPLGRAVEARRPAGAAPPPRAPRRGRCSRAPSARSCT